MSNDDAVKTSNMVSEEEGKPWIKVISNDDAVKTNSMDSEAEGKGEAKETDEKDEKGEVGTTKAEVRSAYVAVRKLRFPGLGLIGKALKRKQRKKTKRTKTKWILEPDSKDKDWMPPRDWEEEVESPSQDQAGQAKTGLRR